MNGLDLLVADHRRVDTLFAQFEATGDGALVGQVLDALSAHDEAEHAALYPLVASVLGDTKMVQRCLAAHEQVKRQIDVVRQLEGLPLVTAFAVLRELVKAHVKDEESRVLPALADRVSPAQLDGLAARVGQVKQRVG